MAGERVFAHGEKVLVPHVDKFYEAKVTKAERRPDGQWHYLLHYTGWNKKYDEWVEEVGLTKSPTANAFFQQKRPPLALLPPGVVQPSARSSGGNPKKRKAESEGTPDQPAGPPPISREKLARLSMELSLALKKQLLDDHDAIIDEGKLVPLPREPNVNEILQHYVDQMAESGANREQMEELALGLRIYFDKALQHCLLYKEERAQAVRVLSDGRLPSAVYGAEHFLRLFVKLPELLPHSRLPEERLAQWLEAASLVVRFLHANMGTFFMEVEDYADATSLFPEADTSSS